MEPATTIRTSARSPAATFSMIIAVGSQSTSTLQPVSASKAGTIAASNGARTARLDISAEGLAGDGVVHDVVPIRA